MTLEHKLKWLARFFSTTIEKSLLWKLTTMEEDGGAWDRVKFEGETLEDAAEKMWKHRGMEKRIKGVLAYRELNYPNETDEQLGLTEAVTV